jgi:FixJ family two-component response regulator
MIAVKLPAARQSTMDSTAKDVEIMTPLSAVLRLERTAQRKRRAARDGDAARDSYRSFAASTAGEPTVFVVDHDTMALRSVERLLRSKGRVVRAFVSAASFFRAIDPSVPGCVLIDLALPDATGLEVQRQLIAMGFDQPIVFLSSCGTVRSAVQAMKAGAEDVIEKPLDPVVLLSAVERAVERDRRQRARRLEGNTYAARLESLTPRERQVLGHVIAGRLNKQIAARLGTAEKTVKVHRARVRHKMSVRAVAELTRVADFIGVRPEV